MARNISRYSLWELLFERCVPALMWKCRFSQAHTVSLKGAGEGFKCQCHHCSWQCHSKLEWRLKTLSWALGKCWNEYTQNYYLMYSKILLSISYSRHTHTHIYIYIYIYLFINDLQTQWYLQTVYNFLTLKDSNFFPGWLFYVFPTISV
jgi:hypothetical protein